MSDISSTRCRGAASVESEPPTLHPSLVEAMSDISSTRCRRAASVENKSPTLHPEPRRGDARPHRLYEAQIINRPSHPTFALKGCMWGFCHSSRLRRSVAAIPKNIPRHSHADRPTGAPQIGGRVKIFLHHSGNYTIFVPTDRLAEARSRAMWVGRRTILLESVYPR